MQQGQVLGRCRMGLAEVGMGLMCVYRGLSQSHQLDNSLGLHIPA